MLVPTAGPLSAVAAGVVLVVLGLAALVLAAGVSRRPHRPSRRRTDASRRRRPDAAIAAETTLLRQLTTAEITRREYSEQIEQLAARAAR
jgi:acetyl-CoA acetyltransferase